jgi:rare lipoprotein A
MMYRNVCTIAVLGGLLTACGSTPMPQAEAKPAGQTRSATAARPAAEARPAEPLTEVGEASYYGPEFNGRRTASGERFDPNSNTAAHRNLPLGTTARVTNLANGRSATVHVRDRGPHARGRIIDVSPATARQLGMQQQGTAPVKVQPLNQPHQQAGQEAER